MKILSRLFALALFTVGAALHAASLKVNLAPSAAVTAGAQWRVDSGTWRNSGTTVSGLSNGSHTVDFKSITGWITPAAQPVTLSGGTTTLTGTYVQAASLKITLTPTSGQWRVDGGAWQASGATLGGLTPGSHTVSYSSLTGYAALASEPVTLTSGQTTTFSRSYTQLAQLKITLSPTTAQWRVDGGAWQASGATVANLSVGTHAVSYSAVAGYTAPANENVALASGQLLTLNRSYVQLAQLSVTLTPGTAQWRVDGGAWQSSGATVTNLAIGSHTVDYAALSGYTAPTSESVTLASGQSLTLNRSYVQLAQLSVTLTPGTAQWRVDGGAWQTSGATVTNLAIGSHTIDYAALGGFIAPSSESVTLSAGQSLTLTRNYVQLAQITVTLSPSSGQWQIDGGAWQASGATVANLTPGSHTVSYAALTNYDAPSTETVNLAAGQAATLTRSYTPHPAQITVTLSPSSGQWSVDGGAWQNSGASVGNLLPGSHAIAYASVTNYDAPISENVSVTPGQTVAITRSYTPHPALLTVTLTNGGQWNIDGGTWQNSGATVGNLSPGSHSVAYSAVANYDAPATETVNLAAGDTTTLSRSYTPHPAQISVTLSPSSGQWSVDGGAWQNSGASVGNLLPGSHAIAYASVTNYDAPTSENVSVTPGQTVAITRSYTPHPAQLTVTLTNGGQWNIDGGTWQNSGATVGNLSPGSHSVAYSAVANYDAPATETVNLAAEDTATLSRSYTPHPAQISVTLSPSSGQWSVDGGAWQNSGASVGNLLPGSHTITYASVANYDAPTTETVNLAAGDTVGLTRSYTPHPAQVTLTTNPSSGQWMIYPTGGSPTGNWNASGATVTGLAPGNYSFSYSSVSNYTNPTLTSVVLNPGDSKTLSADYVPLPASLTVTLGPPSAQWRIDGGSWNANGATVGNLAPGVHVLTFSDVAGAITPDPITTTLSPGQSQTLHVRYLSAPASVTVTLTPSQAQWQLDGGAWNSSATTLGGLAEGNHTIAFSSVAGFVTPAPMAITLTGGQVASYNITYTALPTATINVALNVSSAQWRIDGGAWNPAGSSLSGIFGGNHLIEFSNEAGYTAPISQTITVNYGDSKNYSFLYKPQGGYQFTLNLTPATGQWRIDGGAWNVSGATVANLAEGDHTIEYSAVLGYNPPGSNSVHVGSGWPSTYNWSYGTTVASFEYRLNPSTGRWRVNGGSWLTNTAGVGGFGGKAYWIEFQPVAGYSTPQAEFIRLPDTHGNYLTFNRTYTPTSTASVSVQLNIEQGKWRIYPGSTPSGTWQTGSATVAGLAAGTYTIEYGAAVNYGSPTSETLTVATSQEVKLVRDYTAFPARVTQILNAPGAQWSISPASGPSSNVWYNSGDSVANLPAGDYVINYGWAADYITPWSTNITLFSAQDYSVDVEYEHNYQLKFGLNPYTATWRVDGGAWKASYEGVWGLTPGSHLVEFSSVAGYVTPPSETVTVGAANNPSTQYRYYTKLSELTVNLYPYSAQFRVDGGAWQPSGATVQNLTFSSHLIEYANVNGYEPLASETVSFSYSGESKTVSRSYTPLSQLTVNVYPYSAQFRIDGGAWQPSGTTVPNLSFSSHLIEYSNVNGYEPLASEVVLFSYKGESKSIYRSYTPLSQVTVNVYPYSAQFRVDGGAWQPSGATVTNLTLTSHMVEYQNVTGYEPLASETFTFAYSGESKTLYRSYTPLSQLTVNLYPYSGQWRVDGGAWQASGATVANLTLTSHTIDYKNVAGYVPLNSETFTFAYSGESKSLNRTYTALSQLTVTLYPSNAQWRVDGGAWQTSGATVPNLSFTSHTVDYLGVSGYATPASESVSFSYQGQLLSLSRTYASAPYQHRLRFFLNQDLIGSMPLPEVQRRVAQYAAHLSQIFARETSRRFMFDPAADVIVCTANPFSGSYGGTIPQSGYDLWIYAQLTDDSVNGTYGGTAAVDASGAGGGSAKWDQIYDPATLTDTSWGLYQYWRQINASLRVLELTFGAGDYSTLGEVKDASGVSPVAPDITAPVLNLPDAFWDSHLEYWGDPLTANAFANSRLGSPSSLTSLLNLTNFAPVTESIVNGSYRGTNKEVDTLPSLFPVTVKVVDAQTGLPISGASVRVWNRSRPTPPQDTYEETVTAGSSAGTSNFSWTTSPNLLSTETNAKLIKVSAAGYYSATRWVAIYDAQKAKLIDNKTTFEVTIALLPQ